MDAAAAVLSDVDQPSSFQPKPFQFTTSPKLTPQPSIKSEASTNVVQDMAGKTLLREGDEEFSMHDNQLHSGSPLI